MAFMLAAAASAVGLGNLWRFPYLAAQYGGGIFLLVYLVLVVTFGFALMITEVAIGRHTGLSGVEAFRTLHRRFSCIGWIVNLIPLIILPYYCVIGGWVMRYLHAYLTYTREGRIAEIAGDTFFADFIAAPALPLQYGLLFILMTFGVVAWGLKHGIERSNKILMPLLLIMALAIAGYSLLQDGAMEGLKFYLMPDFSKFSYKTVLGAMGQMFYSLSLAMGIMITYGSYMRGEDNIEKSVRQIEWVDTGVSLLCGLMIIPAVFAFSGGSAEAMNAGPGLMFITLPRVFANTGYAAAIGGVFFTLALFAALTSAISLMETVVASIHDTFKTSRAFACLVTLLLTALLAVPSALGYGVWKHVTFFTDMSFLDFFDFLSNSVLMPVAALFTCLFVGWIIGPHVIINEAAGLRGFKHPRLYVVMIRYVAPLLITIILISSMLSGLGLFKI